MTNNENAKYFALGLALLWHNYKTDITSINIVETSVISITGLKKINKEDIEDLKLFNWKVGNDWDENGWAEYFKLEYQDI